MANTDLRTESVPANPALAEKFRALSEQVLHLEQALISTQSVLDAISQGGLLDAAPRDRGDYCRHSSATGILDLLDREVRGALERCPTYPSFFLERFAKDAEAGKLLPAA